ncbi:hypothetical protein H2200_010945 [Cladophialophora chaetospira]|uniref:Uncharacterized protein n=1 Tax=Cladophialophora chaetospira TaxID=386627 RepID=A0AA38X116_9EURO|nr:hypothetical protein H2200_010945 [Cladophialophora chaetospira]
MWPLGGIIAAVAVGFVIITSLGILLALSLERRRHNKILRAHGLTRGLSSYHRPKLSPNEINYAHITAPATQLRRSIQLPYGVISVSHNANRSEDEEKQLQTTNGHPDEYLEVLRPQNSKRMKRSFSGQPLYIPKTRRSSKLKKAVPLERLPKSPLSAITEFSDPPTSAPLDSAGIPTHSTTTLLPEPAVTRPEKYVPAQWPLVIGDSRGSTIMPTEVTEIAARESVLMRRGGGMSHFTPRGRSVSAVSMTSVAPNDPLPPLPTINTPRRARSHDARRSSATSLETVGSSVLGILSSPMDGGIEASRYNALNRRAPTFDLALKREFATPELQAPPAKRTIHGLVTGKSIRSLHPCVDFDDPTLAKEYMNSLKVPAIVIREDSFKTIDASNWALPPLKITKVRGQPTESYRHSMIEPLKLAQFRAVSDPTASPRAEDDVFAIGKALKRPNSVATGNPQHWDYQPNVVTKRHSSSSLDGSRRGHKRQNCMRITNLPIPDLKPGIQRLPELREEHSGAAPEPSVKAFEVKQPRPLFSSRPPTMDYKSSPTPSPFKNAPILTPTPRPARKQYIQPPSRGIARSSGVPRPDSEVFDSTEMDEPMSSPYKTAPRHWPLSPTAHRSMNNTPPSARPSERFESPMLPSPALSSSLLYPRKSLVKGPRSPRNSTQSNSTCNSPLQHKQGHNFRVTKLRESKAQKDNASDKSGMMVGSVNSESPTLDETASSMYSPEISTIPSPPLNKRIMGLRTSNYAPPVSTMASSPTLERHVSRGPSPLAIATTSNTSKLNRADSSTGAKRSSSSAAYLPRSHLSISPSSRVVSMMSTGGSIWEDASVRADSPEPEEEENQDIAPLALRTLGTTDQNQRQAYLSRSSSRLRRESQHFSFPTIIERDFGADHDDVDTENAGTSTWSES